MNRDDVVRGIMKTWDTADDLGLAQIFGTSGVLGVNEDFRDLIFSDSSSYDAIYMKGLELSHYNILLSDFSYFQFSWEGRDLVRYAYYPNPFIASAEDVRYMKEKEELLAAQLISHEDFLLLLKSKGSVSGVPMLRYENAPAQRSPFYHPCSHMHIGFHSENRWAVNRVLTLYAFSLLVFKHYYGGCWRSFGDNAEIEYKNDLERMLVDEKANCFVVDEALFEEVERRSFYFG